MLGLGGEIYTFAKTKRANRCSERLIMRAIGDGIVVFCCCQLKSKWERELTPGTAENLQHKQNIDLSQCRKGRLSDPTREETVRMPNYCLETPCYKQVHFFSFTTNVMYDLCMLFVNYPLSSLVFFSENM